VDEALLRTLTPTVIGILVRRGADFAAAEDAVQDALVEAVRVWPDGPPRDPKGWLVAVAWRKFLDAARADTSRRHREGRIEGEPVPGPGEVADRFHFAYRDGTRFLPTGTTAYAWTHQGAALEEQTARAYVLRGISGSVGGLAAGWIADWLNGRRGGFDPARTALFGAGLMMAPSAAVVHPFFQNSHHAFFAAAGGCAAGGAALTGTGPRTNAAPIDAPTNPAHTATRPTRRASAFPIRRVETGDDRI